MQMADYLVPVLAKVLAAGEMNPEILPVGGLHNELVIISVVLQLHQLSR